MVMSDTTFRGNFIDGEFRPPAGDAFSSENPASPGTLVLTAASDASAVDTAVDAAAGALGAWRRLSQTERNEWLLRVRSKVAEHKPRLAEAIRLEMGKVQSEALIEAGSIVGKLDGLLRLFPHELPGAADGAPGEQRHHPLGVVGIIGPFNFPVHLINTHVIPSLLTGNTVVVKPSEVTPLVGQRYAELFADAGLPPGVFNLVHGTGDVGAALAAHTGIRGLVFTGSYGTARRIRQATFDQPFKKVCLELGGKNPAVVLDDADLDHAVREILLGALLTTGQRCTATSRVIASPGIAARLRDRLIDAFSRIQPGPPDDPATFMGPLANRASRDRFMSLLDTAGPNSKVLVESRALDGGYYVTPGLYELFGASPIVTEELFGPHVAFEVADSEDDAIDRVTSNPFGLSASLFTARRDRFETFYEVVPAGVLNHNRSTNGASGLLPFGGVGMSGNFHSSGAAALKLGTYPVAVMAGDPKSPTPHTNLDIQLGEQR
ncbi:MAG: acyl-CoA reductase-like NAD-dependent aldehyde dehydrogenase [Myxococcota bacterium]